ncbi:MAG TPA: 4Fe-4S binding protein [Myxococcales bacterium]
MKRKIIEIDETRCDGCGQCIDACHEGALALVDGKARLVKDTFCDGLGACIGDCPTGALQIIERDAGDFDQAAVDVHLNKPAAPAHGHGHGHGHGHHAGGGCPGSALRTMTPAAAKAGPVADDQPPPSQLGQWPVQLMLVPPHAPFLKGADLVVCADCVPFTVPDFHARYLAGRSVVVGCPKLDDLDHYAEKLRALVAQARPSRLTVVIMEVPCCGGLAQVAVDAASQAGMDFPLEIHVAGVRGGLEKQVIRK